MAKDNGDSVLGKNHGLMLGKNQQVFNELGLGVFGAGKEARQGFSGLALSHGHAPELALGNIKIQEPRNDHAAEQVLVNNGFDDLALSRNHAVENTETQGLENAYEHAHAQSNGFGKLLLHGADLVLQNADAHEGAQNCKPEHENTLIELNHNNNQIHDDTDHELALIAQGHGFSFLENHDLEVAGGNELDHGLELAIHQNEMIDESSQQVVDPADYSQIVVGGTPPIVQARAVVVRPEHQLRQGQEFPDVNSCRRALRDAAIANRFEMRTVKSDKTRFTAKCASQGCPWRIHAAKLPGVPTFSIRTITDDHTCGGITHVGHQQASVQWVATTVEQHLRENPNSKPKELLEEIHRLHGITLSYKQAWRGKERVMASLRGSVEQDYRLLPLYCEQVKRTNHGSIAAVFVDPNDSCFQRMFVSLQASIYGFINGCRLLLGLDSAQLKNKYVGSLLFASGVDGDGALFPLAFGIVNEETDESWMWFLFELHNLLETHTENMPRLTILSDRRKGIVDAVEASFPTAFHGYCMRHLCDGFQKDFNNAMLVNLFWEAAHAPTIVDFETKILQIEEVSRDAACWIRRLPVRLWATSYFEGTRLGHLTVTKSEMVNAWILDAAGLPVIQMMEYIRRQLMTLFNERREAGMQWNSILVPSAEEHVAQALEHAQGYQVYRVSEAEFEVISHQGHYVVDIKNRACQCRGWQLYGLPCAHAAAALLSCRQSAHRFTECCFTVAAYRKAYSQTIHPVPDKLLWKDFAGGSENAESNAIQVHINPPRSLQPPAQPRKKRVRPADDEGRAKRVVRCSRCQQPGHFRTTCVAPM